jgi:protein SCO1/2
MTKACIVWFSAALLALAWATPLPENSLYHLDSSWRDQNGVVLKLPELRGQIRVVALIYTHCKSVCPAILEQMKTTETRLSRSERSRVGFVLVTLDPEGDSSEQLHQFASERESWAITGDSSAALRPTCANWLRFLTSNTGKIPIKNFPIPP